MEEFYRLEGGGREEVREEVREGDLVAAPFTDLALHRAKVVSLRPGWALLEYIDWGWTAWLSLANLRLGLRRLPSTFSQLAGQARSLPRAQLSSSNITGEQLRGRGRGRIIREEGGRTSPGCCIADLENPCAPSCLDGQQ